MEKKSEHELGKLDLTDPWLDFDLPYRLVAFIPENLELIMEVIEKKLKAGGKSYGFGICLDMYDTWAYLVQEIGRTKFEEAMKVIDTWFEKEPTLRTKIPCVVLELSTHIADKTRLLPFLERWIMRGESYLDVAMVALKIILFRGVMNVRSGIPRNDALKRAESKHEQFLQETLDLLKRVAKSKKLDPSFFIGGEQNVIFQCASLVDGIRDYGNPLNYDQIFKNASIYKNIESFMGKSWFKKMKNEQNKTNVVLRLMSFNDEVFLSNLDLHLGHILKANLLGAKQLKQNLGSNTLRQDYATLSEIGFLSHFLGKSEIELYPSISDKKLDFKIWVLGQPILFEVKNLDMYRYLKAAEGVFMALPDTVGSKIRTEYSDQLKSLNTDLPLFMAIDLRNSEVRIDDVNNSSIKYFEREMKNLSGVIFFMNPLYYPPKEKTRGKIIHNPFAVNPLLPSTLKELERILFS